MYTRKKDYIYILCTLENKIIYSTYTRKQDINTLRVLENKIVYSIYSRKQDCILYVY